MNTSSSCLLSHRFSVTRRAFPAATGAWKPGPRGNPNQLHLKEGIFYQILLLPAAFSTQELRQQPERWFVPRTRSAGGRAWGWCTPPWAPRHLHLPAGGAHTEDVGRGQAATGQKHSRKVPSAAVRKAVGAAGALRAYRQMGRWPREFGEVLPPLPLASRVPPGSQHHPC